MLLFETERQNLVLKEKPVLTRIISTGKNGLAARFIHRGGNHRCGGCLRSG